MLDRLTHRVHILEANGESYLKRDMGMSGIRMAPSDIGLSIRSENGGAIYQGSEKEARISKLGDDLYHWQKSRELRAYIAEVRMAAEQQDGGIDPDDGLIIIFCGQHLLCTPFL